ncbi:SRPBCC family protein [Streptomyces olivaceiscleroticus]|uniref:Aromatic-ring-hydroxylating dioxygenase alpha subunit C-terminal domain-containing protein n=1 Tax=Streptomyces olivaceiscleroticus TaxID=68245 RepID=A0ABN0ZEJ9_9ACTN
MRVLFVTLLVAHADELAETGAYVALSVAEWTEEWHCNWKVAVENAHENHHVMGFHPETLQPTTPGGAETTVRADSPWADSMRVRYSAPLQPVVLDLTEIDRTPRARAIRATHDFPESQGRREPCRVGADSALRSLPGMSRRPDPPSPQRRVGGAAVVRGCWSRRGQGVGGLGGMAKLRPTVAFDSWGPMVRRLGPWQSGPW